MPRPVVALLATVVDFGGIERVLLTLVGNMGAGIRFVPLIFARRDVADSSFIVQLSGLGVSPRIMALDTSRFKYLNPLRNVREAVTFLRETPVDLIHTHGYRADFIGFIAARMLGVPVASTCHGFISTDAHLDLYNRFDAWLLRHFDGVVAVSEQMSSDLVRMGVQKQRIAVITNAVGAGCTGDKESMREDRRARLGVNGADFVFGFVGRLSEEKGTDRLLHAFCRLAAESERVHLLVVGTGPRMEGLRRIANAAGASRRVSFVGFQPEVESWYFAMDAFVLPSTTEGTPMALLEAMARGLPVIASAVGGVPAVVDGTTNGVLVSPTDECDLLEAMRSLVDREELCQRLSDGAQRTALERFSLDRWAGKMSEFYTSLICRDRAKK